MKRVCSLLCAVILITVFLSAMVQPVRAVDREYTFYGTVGETEYFIIHSNAYDEILEAKIYNGGVPGMWLEVSGGATLGLAGEPTTDGEFKVFITMRTEGLGTVDIKVTVYINPAEPSSDGTPVVTKNPTGETVVEGESATFIARADNVRQYCWQFALADASLDASELAGYIGRGVKVSGWNTEKLVIENIPKELDGLYVWCQFVGAETSVDSTAAVLTVVPLEDASPVVTKHPTSETVEEGSEAVFVAKAKYAQEYLWRLVTPDGDTYDCDYIHNYFPGLKVTGATTERITLSNIPLELDGSRLYCMFTAGYTVASDKATLFVTEKATMPPTEEPTEEPTEPSTETATESPTESSTETVTESPNEPSDEAPTEKPSEASTEGAEPSRDYSDKINGTNRKDKTDNGSNTLIIVLIVSIAAVTVAAIAAFTILKLRAGSRSK